MYIKYLTIHINLMRASKGKNFKRQQQKVNKTKKQPPQLPISYTRRTHATL